MRSDNIAGLKNQVDGTFVAIADAIVTGID